MTESSKTERSGLEVRPIRAEEREAWDNLVASSPQGTLFHTSLWQAVVEAGYGGESLLLAGCFDGDKLVGGVAALERRRFGLSMAVMPLLTPYAGYLLIPLPGEKISDRSSRQREILTALSGWMARRFGRESFILAPGVDDPRPLVDAGYQVTPRFTYHIDLTLSEEELWDRLDGHVRRQIRKAERLIPTECALEPGEAWELFRNTFERRGQPCPVSPELFREVIAGERLASARKIFAVSLSGRLASYIVLLSHGRTCYYAVAATSPDALQSGISSWLIWQVLRARAGGAEGPTVFDFVGANIASIARFKEGFNPVLVPHWKLERANGVRGKLMSAAAAARRF